MKSLLLVISVILSFNSTFALSFEGAIGDTYFIWMDLSAPDKNGKIVGSYFYKNKLIPISLNGKQTSKKMELEEQNKNKVAGYFSLTDYGDSLEGKWENPKGTKRFQVLLYKTSAIYKPQNVIDMGYSKVDSSDDYYVTTSSKRLEFARKGILTYSFNELTEGGSYPIGESSYSTIISDSMDVNIWAEIDDQKASEFKKLINSHIQSCLNETRKSGGDSLYTQLLADRIDSINTLDSIFTWKDDGSREICSISYLTNKGWTFYYYDYFHFPHVCLANDLSCEIVIPFKDLKQYLKPSSVLMRFYEP